jgi:ABC-type phosphate/phosphonate transport system substrate-binding protein
VPAGEVMIANARMYSVTPQVGELWQRLFRSIADRAGVPLKWIAHAEPEPIGALWGRADQGAVFMCGLPFVRSRPRPVIVAAPVSSSRASGGQPVYWSELVVRAEGPFRTLEDTFGGRIALTTPDSQSGCLAALFFLMDYAQKEPLFGQIIAPQITPLRAMKAVLGGLADVAPIDSYAFSLLEKYHPELTSQLRVVASTAPTPAPPIVASRNAPASLESAFLEAHNHTLNRELMVALALERFVHPDARSYDVLQSRFDIATGFWREHPFATSAHPVFDVLGCGINNS